MIIVRSAGNLQPMNLVRRTEPSAEGGASRLEPAADSTRESATKIRQTFNEAIDKVRENARAVDKLTTQMSDARKGHARRQVAEIRETIRMLKELLLLFGDNPPKALLQQLQQLARELSDATAVLKENGGQSGAPAEHVIYGDPDPTAMFAEHAAQAPDEAEAEHPSAKAVVVESELAALKADIQEQADDDGNDDDTTSHADTARLAMAFLSASSADTDPQRRADAQLIEKTLLELKALVATVKAARREDAESDRLLKDIDKHLGRADDAVQAMNQPNFAMPAVGNISVRI